MQKTRNRCIRLADYINILSCSLEKAIILFFVMLFNLFVTSGFTDNPIIQTNYTADPAPFVYENRVYLYTTHDEDVIVNDFYTMNEWRCYSSSDMVNWTDHGSPLSYKTFSWANGDAWACQCTYRNGKFYCYVPLTQKTGGMAIGVGISDSPAGPFTDALGHKLVAYGNGYDIDPTVYIDDNDQAYLYWGNGTLWYVKLNENMISYSGNIVTINPKPNGFVEGPWFYNRNNLYYIVYASMQSQSEAIAYATSNSPTGPWTSKGVIMPTQGNSFTNHPGPIDFKGNSYLFYHNGSLPGGGSYHRSVCVEQFTYNENGTIPSLTMTTQGAVQVGSFNPYDTVQAETICWESGVETEICSEGGFNVSSIENGDYIKVKGVDFGTDAATSFKARVASNTSGGKIELRLDSQTGTLIGALNVSGTGGWQSWVTDSCSVSGATGKHDLFLKFVGANGLLFNFNWWKFDQPQTSVEKSNSKKTFEKTNRVLFKDENKIVLEINLPQNNSQGDLEICLFDLNGRKVATLFTDLMKSSSIELPLNRNILRAGTYLISVKQDNKVLLQNSLVLKK